MKKEIIVIAELLFCTSMLWAENKIDSTKQIRLEEVTISSIKADKNASVAFSNLSKKEITDRNNGQDLPYILSQTPSFVATSDAGTGIGYTGFRVRGTDANRVNITINGIPVNEAESQSVFFVNMPDFASSLSSIQVQRGVGTSTNGAAAFGASINMKTETLNPKPYAEISTAIGSFGTNKNMLRIGTGILNNNFSFDVRLSNITSDGYIDRASSDMRAYYLSGNYHTEKTLLRVITFGGNEKTYQAWNGVSSENLKNNRTYNELGQYTANDGSIKFYDNQTDNYSQTHYQLHLAHEYSPIFNLNAALHYTKGEGYYEEYKVDRSYLEYALTPPNDSTKVTDLVRQKRMDNDFYGFTFSLNYKKNKINASLGGAANRYEGDHFGKVIWVRNAADLDISDEWYRNSAVKSDVNIYAKMSYEALSNLFFSADLQGRLIRYKMQGIGDKYNKANNTMRDIAQQHDFSFFNPKLGATYRINEKQNVYGSFAIANREPNRNNYTEAGENEKPTSERLYDTEFGYRLATKSLNLDANVYYMKYKDQLILTGKISEIGEMLTSNIPNSYRMGIEVSWGWQINKMLNWSGNATWSKNKIKNFTEQDVDVYDADWTWIGSQNNYLGTTDIAYSPNLILNNMLTFNYNNFGISLHSNYVGKQYIDNTSNDERSINSYFINNLHLIYSLPLKKIKSIDFQVSINNLFNTMYESNAYTWYSSYVGGERNNDLRYFPQAGTNILASVSLKF